MLKVSGDENPADLGTKEVEEAKMRKFMQMLGFLEAPGRHPRALAVSSDSLGGYGGDLSEEG